MALSYTSYVGNGATTDYTFAFGYLDKADVFVYVNGLAVPYTFLNSSAIRCTTAPANLAVVQVRRLTKKNSIPVNFIDGSNLLQKDLEVLGSWTLYQAQEAADVTTDLGILAGAPLNTAVAAAVQANASAGQAAAYVASALAVPAALVSGFNDNIRANSFSSSAAAPAGFGAQYYAKQTVTLHAQYGFLDDATITYAGGAPIYGHASFNANVTLTGTVASDHHHCYQSYPHYNNSATLNRMSGFWSQPDVQAGMVVELSQHKASDALGIGAITNQFGFYCAALTRGAGNYPFYSEGTARSHLTGGLSVGSIGTPASLIYNTGTGHLEITPRTGYKTFVRGPMLIGGNSSAVEASAATIDNSANTGDLEITPRTTFRTVIRSKLLLGPAAGFEALIENAGSGDLEFTARAGYAIAAKSPMKMAIYTVATLPAAATYVYARAFVTDANASIFNSVVATGGANKVPVFSDGTSWRIG